MSCLPIRPLELLEGSRAGVELEATREVTPARDLEQVIGLVVGKGLRRHGCPSLRPPGKGSDVADGVLALRRPRGAPAGAVGGADRSADGCPGLTGGTRQRTLHRSTPRTRPRTGPWPLSGPWYSCAAGERRRLGPGLRGSLKPRARSALGVREVGQAAEQVGLLRRSAGPAAGLAVRWKAARLGRDARPRAVPGVGRLGGGPGGLSGGLGVGAPGRHAGDRHRNGRGPRPESSRMSRAFGQIETSWVPAATPKVAAYARLHRDSRPWPIPKPGSRDTERPNGAGTCATPATQTSR